MQPYNNESPYMNCIHGHRHIATNPDTHTRRPIHLQTFTHYHRYKHSQEPHTYHIVYNQTDLSKQLEQICDLQ